MGTEDQKYQEQGQGQEVPSPPALPEQYRALGEPKPLLGVCDDRWVVLAAYRDPRARQGFDIAQGILIYEHQTALLYLHSDEAISCCAEMVREAWRLVALCTKDYQEEHQEDVEVVKSAFWGIVADGTYATLREKAKRPIRTTRSSRKEPRTNEY